jgi:YegS/Rv2252/BmrU family lipid kinase
MADNSKSFSKWGLIYSPNPSRRCKRRWKKILQALKEAGQPFDFVQSEGEGSTLRLAAMMTQNGYKTIIIVGGDAALNEAVNGIMHAASPTSTHPTLGIIPNGYANDFAHYWDYHTDDIEDTIARLQRGNKRRIDVGVIAEGASTDARYYFLNCLNIGVVANIIHLKRTNRNFWISRMLADALSALQLIFKRKRFRLKFKVNFETHEKELTTICIGSAHGYGQTPSAVPYNGMLDITTVAQAPFTKTLNGLWLLFTNRFLSYNNVKFWRTRGLEILETNDAPIALDGRIHPTDATHISIGILPEEIEFLV